MERVKMNKIRFSQVVKKGMIIGLVILVAISMLAITVANSEKMSSKSPTTLYVGGSGSGNYTTIQSAITASTSGDTIFVYDDSSPYYENVVINKGISLIGENRETTIIDGYGSSEHGLRYTIYISADWVNVSGFGVRNGDYGIYLGYSSNNSITSNQIYNNSRFGIYLEHSSNNTVTSNQVHNNWYGIYLSSSGYNNISGCTIYNNSGVGVSVFRSPKNIIANNTFTNDGLSISVGYMWVEEERIQAENQTVENNTVNGKPLYYFFDQSDLIIDGWEVGQLILADCINFTIKNLDISYTDRGIELLWSHYNNITDCTLYNNSMGISFLTKCGYNIISNCSVYNNSGSSIGINYCSLFNQISNCTIYNSQGGISTIDGNGEVISNCTIYNNVYGIGFWDTPTNILRNNTLENNTYNLWVHGMDISLCYQDIDTSNTINGKPIYYIIEQDDLVFNETMSIGYLAFVSCNNIRVENLILTNKGFGLTLANTSNSIVANCTLDNNTQGISLYHSANNTITNCTTSDSIYSIYLYHSSYNQITYCNITDNTRPEGHGIHISPFSPSNYNMFHHNNLINNIHNAYASPYTNYWDDGSEGNYWDDYTGIDDDGDDIGDTPYSIYGGIDQDNFPLMFPVGANRPPVIQSYTPVTNPTILETESQMFNITASDPDNDTITISWYLNNSLISTGSSYTFTANYTCAGIYEVKVIVSDGELSASHIWALTVTNVNRVPVLNNPLPDKFFDEDCSLINVFNLNDYFSDPDGEILDYTVSGNNHISVAINDNGTIDLQASTNWHGNETITFRATDPYNAFAEDIIVVTVNSVNDAPVIVGVLPNFDKDEDDPIWMLDLTNNKSDIDN
ncbi:MAG: right-handed parallel beta-helix repeat-containing protein, partial [Thermoplasmatales archaeon]|nr:right-handed parallel beta-helix repeat-containing protein [Thermoplasmatales archaeon]